MISPNAALRCVPCRICYCISWHAGRSVCWPEYLEKKMEELMSNQWQNGQIIENTNI